MVLLFVECVFKGLHYTPVSVQRPPGECPLSHGIPMKPLNYPRDFSALWRDAM